MVSKISIHTTRKVVTEELDKLRLEVDISIHTTRKVVTIGKVHFVNFGKDFNPHHPQGGDQKILKNCSFC